MAKTLRKSRLIRIGSLKIGGGEPVVIQAMAKTKTSSVSQVIKELSQITSQDIKLVRLAIKDKRDLQALKTIKKEINCYLVGDIHFDHSLAIEAINKGIDKIRLNPGNIYQRKHILEIIREAKLHRVPIRIGANSGSLKGPFFERYKRLSYEERMLKGVLDYIRLIEDMGFKDLVISLKSSEINSTLKMYRKIASLCNYPLHLGLTATGTGEIAVYRSVITISTLLLEGIGDTFRVSLTDSSLKEIEVAKQILKSINLNSWGWDIISCPSCGRSSVDLIKVVNKIKKSLPHKNSNKKLAIMGCMVNGPGEAKEADLGIAFGERRAALFKKGKIFKGLDEKEAIKVFLKELKNL